MPIDPVNPLGWGTNDPITSAQMNGIDQRLVRAVDGVQGGAYSGPLTFSNAQLTGTSGANCTGNLTTKGLVEGLAFVETTNATKGLANGGNVDCNGLLGTVFVATVAGPTGPISLTVTWEFVLANVEYTFILDHSALIAGTPIVLLTWGGAGMTHRFGGGQVIDGQPTPHACRDVWRGFAISQTEILWTVTRGLI